jgi:two-component system, cell cycle sensor histidine kinase and response regulator CckA
MRNEERNEIEELRFHRLALDQSPDAVVVIDGAGRLLHANQAARDVHGAPSRILRDGLVDGGELAGFVAVLRASGRASAEKRVLDGEGTWRQLVLKGTCIAPERFAVFARDVTERREMEAELEQLRRVESLGYLTASVVHDFNNLLTPMVCLSAVLTHELERGSHAGEMAMEIRETAERAAGLARQMLSFVRRAPEQARRLNVGAVVSEMNNLLRRVVGDDIEIVLSIDEDSGEVSANREQLEQVLLNLAVNARDAMPRGGRLVVATAPVTLVGEGDPEQAQAGAYVALRVSDTGVGMTAEVRERIFERFFTTKSPGEGTGLGLAAAHRFARASGGCISVRSAEGAGTTVTLCLPRLEGVPTTAPPSSHELLPRGSETVLVVEDDASVRGVVRALLEAQGYRVLDAPCGKAALEVVARKPGPIDLLIVDVVMPEMGGRALADALASTGLSMKVLFMSGHSDAMVLERGVNPSSSMFLRKAFSPAELILKVREVLGEERRRVELKLA